MRNIKPIPGDKVDYIINHFPDTTNRELARVTGVSRSTIGKISRRYGLHKSAEHSHRMHQLSGKAANSSWERVNRNPECIRKRTETFMKTYRTDKARIAFGLEQKTRLHINHRSVAQSKQRYRLVQNGYIIDDAAMTAYYTPETVRCVRLEKIPRGLKKGRLKPFYDFKPIKDRIKRGTTDTTISG